MEAFLDELDPVATLAAAAGTVAARRAAAVRELEVAAHWADLHGEDPQGRPGAVPVRFGGDRLVDFGGEGTPLLQELCVPELAIALGVHAAKAGSLVADALDLRHRLPRTWLVVRDLGCEPWLARRVAAMSRPLERHRAAVVDEAVAPVIASESPGRVLRIAEAAIIEADPVGHAAKVEAALRARYVRLSRTDEQGLRHVIARIEAGDAVWVDALLARIVEVLRTRPDLGDLPADATEEERRAEAFGWLAHPEDLADLLAGHQAADPGEPRPRRSRAGRSGAGRSGAGRDAVVYVHLCADAVAGVLQGPDPVASVDGLGPMLLDQVRRMLGHAQVRCAGVIDLNTTRAVDAYAHPADVVERTMLRTRGEVFPHATRANPNSRRVDIDHLDPYLAPARGGPPGQTGDHNAGPLSRRSHRAKTHRPYRVTQLRPGEYLWRTPHGIYRHVHPDGTSIIDEPTAHTLTHGEALQDALDRIERKLRTQG